MATKTENGTVKSSGSVLAGDLIRAGIKSQPKMSPTVAAQVARNFDNLLQHLKQQGVSMHAVCRAAALGNPEDRDSKALYKYRNPEGSDSRAYITQASKFVKLAEAIAQIDDHPYSGTSSQILSRVFSGTPYSGELSQFSEASITVKSILDEVVGWVARQVDIAQAYRQLLPPHEASKPLLQFKLLQGWVTPLHLELGARKLVINDKTGHPIQLRNDHGVPYELHVVEKVSLFIGVDKSYVPRPFLGFKKSLRAIRLDKGPFPRLTNQPSNAEIYELRDGPRKKNELGEIIFHSSIGPLRLTEDVVSRSVDLALLAERIEFPVPNQGAGEPLVSAYILANHELWESNVAFGSNYEDWSDEHLRTMPATADTLESLEKFLSGPEGKFFVISEDPDHSSPFLVPAHPFHGSSLYGHEALGQLINCFTKHLIFYVPNETEQLLLGLKMPTKTQWQSTDEDDTLTVASLLKSPMMPSGGWIGAKYGSYSGFRWTPADILWFRTKILVTLAESEAEKEKLEIKTGIDGLLRRLKSEND